MLRFKVVLSVTDGLLRINYPYKSLLTVSGKEENIPSSITLEENQKQKGVSYFRCLLNAETEKLAALGDMWESIGQSVPGLCEEGIVLACLFTDNCVMLICSRTVKKVFCFWFVCLLIIVMCAVLFQDCEEGIVLVCLFTDNCVVFVCSRTVQISFVIVY